MSKKEVIQLILDAEMQDIKHMRKSNLRGLVRELLEDRLYEMAPEAVADYYFELTGK